MTAPLTCGCCGGTTAETPARKLNRPGLPAISYRAGTWSEFKATLLARLSSTDYPALAGLTTRRDDDWTIALCDACAVLADVLTFYQERIANESYLRTAAERRSVLELARLIGYRLAPGVAAAVYLAFTVEDAAGAPGAAEIPAGAKVQSVPARGAQPQTFETSLAITARKEWNALHPRASSAQNLVEGISAIYVQGSSSNIKAGDAIVVSSGVYQAATHAAHVDVDFQRQVTRVTFDQPVPSLGGVPVVVTTTAWGDKKIPFSAANIQQNILHKTWQDADLNAFLQANEWDVEALADFLAAYRGQHPQVTGSAYVMRARVGIFGNNAPRYDSLPASQRFGEWVIPKKADGTQDSAVFKDPAYPSSWEARDITTDSQGASRPNADLFLERTMPAVQPGGYIALEDGAHFDVFPVTGVLETTLSDYGVSAKATGLSVDKPFKSASLTYFSVRGTTAYVQSEQLSLTDLPLTTDLVAGTTQIELDGFVFGIRIGQAVSLSGERADAESLTQNEILIVKAIQHDHGWTVLTFESGLAYSYVRRTVSLNANTVPGTHGESVSEIGGSGDAGRKNQTFALKQSPLTYVSDATDAEGRAATLTATVNGVTWSEVPTLYGGDPRDRIYALRRDDGGRTTVHFGDGDSGARLPSGQNNVRFAYRKGLGTAGNLRGGQLTTLLTRPPGVKGVTNPAPSSGGQDPEKLEDARGNAPLRVLTLDRAVSIDDYANYARAFAGIAKACAIWIPDPRGRGVHLTVAGSGGEAFPAGAETIKNLVGSLRRHGDAFIPLDVKSYKAVSFSLKASLKVAGDRDPDAVSVAVAEALRVAYSFDAREFGQPVTLDEVYATIQNVAGVVAADIDQLYRCDAAPGQAQPAPRLLAALPSVQADGSVSVAELLTLDPGSVDFGVMP